MPQWRGRIEALIREMPTATEDEIGWKVVEEMSANGAALLKPIFDAHGGRNGRLSIQTDPRFYRNSRAILEQALRFNQLAPNMIVKIPATRAGVAAMEEATYRGVSVNAAGTVHPASGHCRGRGRRARPGAPRKRGPSRSPPWVRCTPSWWAAWTIG